MAQGVYTAHASLGANGNTETVALPGIFSKVTLFFGTGVTFGSGTIKAQVSPDGGTTWLDSPNGGSITTATASSKKADYDIFGPMLRWNLAGSTTPTLHLRTRAREMANGIVKEFSFAADGQSNTFVVEHGIQDGVFAWAAYGTFGSGTVSLQASPDAGTTWFTVDSTAAAAFKHITTNEDTLYRFSLAGSTNPALNLRVYTK